MSGSEQCEIGSGATGQGRAALVIYPEETVRDAFARRFYSSGAWADCRAAYRESVANLCENCLKCGMITPADEVHHKIRLTPANINDPTVTLNWENLEALCEKCHKLAHKRKRRYQVGEDGELRIRDTPL